MTVKKTVSRLNKDAWISEALIAGVILPRADGAIFRPKRVAYGDDGEIRRSAEIVPVTLSLHKKTGRVYFNLTFRGVTKSVLVNRVVALAFIPNPERKPEVNHIDGDKTNNAAANLEWATRSEQERHAFATGIKSNRGSANSKAKLNAQDVLMIRASKSRDSDLATALGVSVGTIRAVRDRRTWTHL